MTGASGLTAGARGHMPVTLKHLWHVEHFEHYHLDGQRCVDVTCRMLSPGMHTSRMVWQDEFENLVTTAGLNHYLVRTIKGQSGLGGASGGYNDGRRLPTKWLAATVYTAGDVVRPSGASGQLDNNRFFICKISGTSHATTEPTWPNSANGTVVDNTVTWLELSQFLVGLITGPGSGNTYVAADTMASHAGWAENAAYSDATRRGYVPGAVAAGSVDNSASKAVFNINATATIAGCFLTDIDTKSGTLGLLFGEGNFSGGDRLVQSGDTLNVTVTISLS